MLVNGKKETAVEMARTLLPKVPMYSKDKAGNNINILLLQILTQLQREQFGNIIDRTDSLREYARKYTRNPETKRANIFIKMILKMEKAQFHRSGTETKPKKLLELPSFFTGLIMILMMNIVISIKKPLNNFSIPFFLRS